MCVYYKLHNNIHNNVEKEINMRIGVRGHDVEHSSLENLFENIHKQGFHCTQLALSKAVKEFKVNNGVMTPGLAFYIRELCAENKVDVSVLGCYLNLANPNKESLGKTQETYEAHIRFASLVGAGMVGTETGAVNEEYSFTPDNHTDKALDVFIEGLKPVVEYAEKMGVIIAIEPVYKHIVCNFERARKVLDTINSPNLQLIFDPVNVIYAGNYEKQDEIIRTAFELCGDDICCMHLKDFVVENGEVKSVISGRGLLNYPLLMSYVKTCKPFVHCLLEDTNPDNAAEAKRFVEEQYENAALLN